MSRLIWREDKPFWTHASGSIVFWAVVAWATAVPFFGIFQLYPQPGWVDPGLYFGAFVNLSQNLKDYGASYHAMRLPYTLVGYALHHTLSPDAAVYSRVVFFNAMALVSLAAIIVPTCGRFAAAIAVLWLGLNPGWIAALTRGYVDGAAMAYAFAALAFFFNRKNADRPILFVLFTGFFASLTLFAHPAAFIALGFVMLSSYAFTKTHISLVVSEIVIGLLGFAISTALLAIISKMFGGEYLFFRESLPEVSRSLAGSVVFRLPLAEWLPMALRLAAGGGLIIVSVSVLAWKWKSANDTLVSGTLGLVAFAAFMIFHDTIIGGTFLQSSYYAGYAQIAQALVIGGLAGMTLPLRRAESSRAFPVVAASVILLLVCYAHADLTWKLASKIDRDGWMIWFGIIFLSIIAAWLFSSGRRAPALAMIFLLTQIGSALNKDTRNIFRTTDSIDYASTFHTALATFEIVQQIASPDRVKIFMFNRDDLTTVDAHRSTTTYTLRYLEKRFVMNLWDTIAALWGWDLAVVGGYMPEILPVQLDYLKSRKDRPMTIVSFCLDEQRCDVIERALNEQGFVLVERARKTISGFGYIPFVLRVADIQ